MATSIAGLHRCPHCSLERPRGEFTSGKLRSDSICFSCKQKKRQEKYQRVKSTVAYRNRARKNAKAHYWRHIEANRKRTREYQRKIRTEQPEKMIFALARQRAQRKGMEFSILVSDVQIPKKCPILGIRLKPMRTKQGNWEAAPTIDRIRNDIGYVKDNIAVISRRANVIKSFGTANEHRKIAEWIDRTKGKK